MYEVNKVRWLLVKFFYSLLKFLQYVYTLSPHFTSSIGSRNSGGMIYKENNFTAG